MTTTNHKITTNINPPNKKTDGFTIVELIVAAVIIIIAVVAVVAVVRKSTDMQVNDYHRRQARAIIMNVFETKFAHNHYGGSYKLSDEANATSYPITTAPVTYPIGNIIIDKANPSVVGTMDVTMQILKVTAGTPPVDVDVHDIKILLRWQETDGSMDSVVLTKQLANVQ